MQSVIVKTQTGFPLGHIFFSVNQLLDYTGTEILVVTFFCVHQSPESSVDITIVSPSCVDTFTVICSL